ncbi:MAG: FAD-dependent oxidoreductase [Myxococcota bacterium]|nr:FAD-dependent oxidoreductase [Myxococcota bacterium]
MRSESRVVVMGGGIAGCSVLYHLTRLGWTDVTLLEAEELTSGSTWHAAGLCTQLNSSYNITKLLKYSVDLYQTLAEETGQEVDFHKVGSIRLAFSDEQVYDFQHRLGIARLHDIPCELISPERVTELFPLSVSDGVVAAAHTPTDGYVDPTGVTQAFAKGATSRGAEIVRHAPVLSMEHDGEAWCIKTPKGEIRAEIVVNAAGQWARQVGQMVGLELPIVPIEHHYLITEPVPEVAAFPGELPVLRDTESSFYIRAEHDGLLVGPFEPSTVAWSMDGVPEDFHSQLLEPELTRLEGVLQGVANRVPVFGDAGIKTVVNGPDGYTPDGGCLMGPVPGLPNYHVLAGFSIFGIIFGGGAGRYAAEWIVDGQPSDNMWELDVRRFSESTGCIEYAAAKALDVYAQEYKIHFPEEEREAGRPLKTGPLYDRLKEKGAVFGARFGWERPLWFAKGEPAKDEYSFRRGNWHDRVGEECRAVRSTVGVLDQTSFAKFEVSGPGAEAYLDRLCANRLPRAVGRIVLTQMLTPRGGIECDVTVTRLAGDRFYVVSAAATEAHDFAWMERHLPDDGSVYLDNVTDQYAVLTLAGPRSRELLQSLTRADVSHEAFRFFRCREFRVGMAPVRALRVSYVGELGYELHHPVAYQRFLYERLMEAGSEYGLIDFGYRALDSMRLEKAYRLWGVDMSADYTPLEAGMERFVALDKGDFIGRDALVRQQEAGPEQGLACLVVDSTDADPHGEEPVRAGDELIGYVAAGGYGYVVEKTIALAYLPSAYLEPGTRVEIEMLGERVPAEVVAQPLYDPKNERLLS